MADDLISSPVREFGTAMDANRAKQPGNLDQAEDRELTDFLMGAWSALVSPLLNPAPSCPRCGGQNIRGGSSKSNHLPRFFCYGCSRRFNRLTGTPFVNLADHARGTAIIPLLSRELPIQQAMTHLGWSRQTVMSWLLAFRRWLLELDSTGQWEARVRLGIRTAPLARCRRCGFEGGFRPASPDSQGRRRLSCPQCGHSRQLALLQKEGQALDRVVVHDVIDTAARAWRKTLPDLCFTPVAGTSCAGALTSNMKRLPRLADIGLPTRQGQPGSPCRQEDLELSTFLAQCIDAALSLNIKADPCPWCGSKRAEYQPAATLNHLPSFQCRGCQAHFTRVSNTPLAYATMRERAWRLVPMLGWQVSGQEAARELGISVSTLDQWVCAWRQWLLVLDPTRAMEAKVRLGLPTEDAESSGQVGEIAEKGSFAAAGSSPNRSSTHMANSKSSAGIQRVPSRRKAKSLPSSNSEFLWERMRTAKRKLWMSRAWKKNAAGEAILLADGYLTKVTKTGDGSWGFELRGARAKEVCLALEGYHSDEAARLAAFDAITDLLSGQIEVQSAHNRGALGWA